MKKLGEFLFNGFDEAQRFVKAPTNYEKENDITIVKEDVLDMAEDLKVMLVDKSDNSKTMFLFFKNSTKYDVWKFWCPSQSQIKLLSEVVSLFNSLDAVNVQEKFRLEPPEHKKPVEMDDKTSAFLKDIGKEHIEREMF